MSTVSAVVSVAKCWKELIDVEFPDDLSGILSEKHQKGIEDPNPYYDDVRFINFVFDNNERGTLSLCSGQSNYYGAIEINEGEIFSDILESFNKRIYVMANNKEYVVNLSYY